MATEPLVLTWDEETVQEWLSSIGYNQYFENIIEHGISGDVLIHLDFETLRDIGISSAGHRLDILRAIYKLKLDNHIPIEADHYVPLSEADEDAVTENTPLGRIMQMITNQNQRIQNLEQENQRLQRSFSQLEEWAFGNRPPGANGLSKQPSLKWASYGKPVMSPTRAVPDDHSALGIQPQDSPRISPQSMEHEVTSHPSSTLKPPKAAENTDSVLPAGTRTSSLPPYTTEAPPYERNPPSRSQTSDASTATRDTKRPPGEDRSDNVFQSFKVSLDDPCSKVLPAALKKYKITDDWRLYALFICYGTTERCLSLDEKPLLLFKKLKDAGKNPVFMLRHVRDIRAPITVAQGKQAEKKARGHDTSPDSNQTLKAGNTQYNRDGRLQTPAAILPSTNGSTPKTNGYNGSHEDDRLRMPSEDGSEGSGRQTGNGPGHTDAVILWTGTSYAVAIYPYGAGYDDEFDVTVGAMFVVLRRSKGWWQVQRDPSGAGAVDENAKRGWVPAGCLLETNAPPATAVAEATMLANGQPNSPADVRSLASPAFGQFPMSDAPILPSSIISTSYPGIALMDWLPQGDHELDLVKDDILRVFKRYNHWSYVVKEGGRRGWVPSWLIGKASSSSGNLPQTPMTAPHYDGNGEDAHHGSRGLGSDMSQQSNQLPQPSPMSTAFTALR
ncbi:Adaptor for signal transduction [Tulasnella sp. JGI-2019a]|nr:Adaptor for signal transduction [Tulasnella sp. JGI-2019a]